MVALKELKVKKKPNDQTNNISSNKVFMIWRRVLPPIRMAVALEFFMRWGLMGGFRDAKSTAILYEIGDVFFIATPSYVVLARPWLK